jgi:signal transduction histidine kinase
MLERVNAAGQRLRRLLDELGDAAWATEGVHALPTVESVDLGAAVTKAIARSTPLAAARDVIIDDDRASADLAGFTGDPELLEAAVAYALEFAIARSRGQHVGVSTTPMDDGARIQVTDHAGALSPDRLAHLFEPFLEKEALPPRGEAGQRARDMLGLGLAICKGILEAHGGDLSAEPTSTGDGVSLSCKVARRARPSP